MRGQHLRPLAGASFVDVRLLTIDRAPTTNGEAPRIDLTRIRAVLFVDVDGASTT